MSEEKGVPFLPSPLFFSHSELNLFPQRFLYANKVIQSVAEVAFRVFCQKGFRTSGEKVYKEVHNEEVEVDEWVKFRTFTQETGVCVKPKVNVDFYIFSHSLVGLKKKKRQHVLD